MLLLQYFFILYLSNENVGSFYYTLYIRHTSNTHRFPIFIDTECNYCISRFSSNEFSSMYRQPQRSFILYKSTPYGQMKRETSSFSKRRARTHVSSWTGKTQFEIQPMKYFDPQRLIVATGRSGRSNSLKPTK